MDSCECGSKISGIKCEATHCKYHSKDNCCVAGHIEVGTTSATNTDDTMCATFECK